MSLTGKFRRWWKGDKTIVNIQQGDDNLIVVLFYNKDTKDYEVGTYQYFSAEKEFRTTELETELNREEAISKFNQIVKEF